MSMINVPKMTNKQLSRFLAKVKISDTECWEWQGAKNSGGYGALELQGVTYGAHRVSFNQFNGPIVDGNVIRHKCDNRKCVNPEHLLQGSYSDNTNDMVERGRVRTKEYYQNMLDNQ